MFQRCRRFSTSRGFPKAYSLHSPGSLDCQPLMMEDISHVQWAWNLTSKKGHDLNSHLASQLSSTVRQDSSKHSQNDGFIHSIRYYHHFLLKRAWEESLSNWSYKFTDAVYTRYKHFCNVDLKMTRKKAPEILLPLMSPVTTRYSLKSQT